MRPRERSPRLLTPEEVAQLLRVTPRHVLQLPIKQVRMGHRTIRYRLRDVYDYLGIEDPNAWWEEPEADVVAEPP